MSKPLKPQQIIAINLLAQGHSQKQVAEELEITPQTMSAWVKQPDFKAELRDLSSELCDTTVSRMFSLRVQATERLAQILDTGAPNEQLNAIRIVLGATAYAYDPTKMKR